MKKLRLIILNIIFYSLSANFLFPFYSGYHRDFYRDFYSEYNDSHYRKSFEYDDVNLEGFVGILSILLNFYRTLFSIKADKLYRKNKKSFNKVFKTYLILDGIDCLKFENNANKRICLLHDLYLFLKKNNELFKKEKFNENLEKEKEDILKKQKKFIVLKNMMFVFDGICSVLRSIVEEKTAKKFFENTGLIAKFLARAIDTKNCKISRFAWFLIIPCMGNVNFLKNKFIKNDKQQQDNYEEKSKFYESKKQERSGGFEKTKKDKDFFKQEREKREQERKRKTEKMNKEKNEKLKRNLCTYYEVLGIGKKDAVIDKKKLRLLKLKAHPDKGGSTEYFRLVDTAYNCLDDESRRELYDSWLENKTKLFYRGYGVRPYLGVQNELLGYEENGFIHLFECISENAKAFFEKINQTKN